MKPSKQSKELAGALAEDQRRQAIDAAKKRAVAQQVDYDTFKNMVSVAHLKPLQAPAAKSAGCLVPAWGLDTTGILSASPSPAHQIPPAPTDRVACSADSSICTSETAQVPRNSQEFLRDWRRSCPNAAAKYRLLKLCGSDGLSQIFKVEITGDLLGQVLSVLQQEWSQCAQDSNHSTSTASASSELATAEAGNAARQQEAIIMAELLHSLTSAGRFDLNARLMGSKAKQIAEQLCNDLQVVLQLPGSSEIKHGTTDAAMQELTSSSTSAGRCTASHNSSSTTTTTNSRCGGTTAVSQQNTSDLTVVQQQLKGVQVTDCCRRPSQNAPQIQQQQQLDSPADKALEQLAHIRRKLHIVTE